MVIRLVSHDGLLPLVNTHPPLLHTKGVCEMEDELERNVSQAVDKVQECLELLAPVIMRTARDRGLCGSMRLMWTYAPLRHGQVT